MTRLVVPDVRLRDSLVETIADFGDEFIHGSGFWVFEGGRVDTSPEGLPAAVRTLLEYADPAHPLPDGMVHCDHLWVTDDDPEQVIGFLALRHSLNDFLLEEGGHIGYSIRPARRGQGHAARALGLALDRAAELGIERALVTCDDDNEASRRTIERNGGVYEYTRKGKLRYWIETSGRVTPAGSGAARP